MDRAEWVQGMQLGSWDLEHFPCEKRLWDQGWFSWEKGWLQTYSTVLPAPAEVEEEMQLDFSQWCVAGIWKAVKQALTWEAQARKKEKPFLQEDRPAMKQVVQSHYTISVLGAFQDSAGQKPEQICLNSGSTLLWTGGWAAALPKSLPTELISSFWDC